jgi:HD-GYP domain-containing protein (c-di-GMP phosphodiesterase class II)
LETFLINGSTLDILKALAFVIDSEEKVKLYHSWRTAFIAKKLGDKLCKESALALYVAGLLHDIGTFDLSNSLMHHALHRDAVSHPEIRIHPQRSAAIVSAFPGLIPIAKIVIHHHEWVNGEGYPHGLTEKDLSLEAQILRISDSAGYLMETHSVDEAFEILSKNEGKEFSSSLYRSLKEIFTDPFVGKTAVNSEALEAATNDIFSELPCERELDPISERAILYFFGRVLDTKHKYSERHSQRVSYYSMILGIALRLPSDRLRKLEYAAYLHDIGKLGIPKALLDKPGPLTTEEFHFIQKHALISHSIVNSLRAFSYLAEIVRADQEHFDGSGYPLGLKGHDIPLESRIIFVSDAFDAMISDRAYRKALPVSKALAELKRCAGKDFDPQIVEVACQVFNGFDNQFIVETFSH